MQSLLEEPAVAASPWPGRRRRALELRQRHGFAAEVLTLYLSLIDAQEAAFEAARAKPPAADNLVAYVAEAVLPRVVAATVAAGPDQLVRSVTARFDTADFGTLVAGWLADEDQPPVDRYLARASCGPVLEAVPGLLTRPAPAGNDRRCPSCGGAPGLSCFGASREALVTAPRQLLCSRCAGAWIYPRMICASCGETDTSRLPIYSDPDRFPHLRIDGCQSCRRYLVTVDLPKDPEAVPVVDEIAAIPLALYAQDRGMTKVVPNLMGI
jgi:FdhE protein